jgi:hypothetical protein
MKPDGSGAAKPLFVALDGMFKNGEYGFELNDFRIRALNDEEIETLINGTPEQRSKVESAWAKLMDLIGSMEDATYRELCRRVAGALGKQFCRAAGVRAGIGGEQCGGAAQDRLSLSPRAFASRPA